MTAQTYPPSGSVVEQQFGAILRATPDAIVIIDQQGQIVLVNDQATQLFGHADGELLGQPIEVLIPSRYHPAHVGHRAAYQAEPKNRPMGGDLELYARLKNGVEFPVEISLSAVTTQAGDLVLSAIRDVTVKKQVQADRVRLANIVESSSDAIVSSDRERQITSWNASAERLLGWTAADLLGQPLSAIYPPGTFDPTLRERVVAGETFQDYEAVRLRKDGSEIPVAVTISALRDACGQVIGFSDIIRDISERKALERQQREFIAMVNHDLMNPITAIGLHAELLQLTESYVPRSVENIMAAARRLERLVGDLLDVSRLETGHLQLRRTQVDLAKLVKECADQVAITAGDHEIGTDIEASPLGWWDRTRLEQVCQNLITNAVKYSPSGQAVRVGVGVDREMAQLVVRDQGVGIPEADLPFVFDRFYRVKAHEQQATGLGLGLYITRSLVELHGGDIAVQSRVGAGTTFTVSLPYGEPDDDESGIA
jgi:PAS domain S-box-containing protein